MRTRTPKNNKGFSVSVSIIAGLLLALIIAYFVATSSKSILDKDQDQVNMILIKSKLIAMCLSQCMTDFTNSDVCNAEIKEKNKEGKVITYTYTKSCSFFTEIPVNGRIFEDGYRKKIEVKTVNENGEIVIEHKMPINEKCAEHVLNYVEAAKEYGLPGSKWSSMFNKILTKTYDGKSYAQYLVEATNEFGIDFCLALGIMYRESAGNSDAVSKAGAMGLMQLTQDTAKDECRKLTSEQRIKAGISSCNNIDLKNPRQNIYLGTKYLSTLYYKEVPKRVNKYHYIGNKLGYTIGSYNSGPGNLEPSKDCRKYCDPLKVPKFDCLENPGRLDETQKYIPIVLTAFSACKELGYDKKDYSS